MNPIRVAIVLRFPGPASQLTDDPSLRVWRVNPNAEAPLGDGPRRYDVALIDSERCDLIAAAVARQISVIALAEWDQGLERAYATGCDYFLAQPFSTDELRAYIRTLMWRKWFVAQERADPFPDIWEGTLHLVANHLILESETGSVKLTPLEHKILLILLQAHGAVVPHARLQRHWGKVEPKVARLNLAQTIFFLRRRLLQCNADATIDNVLGIGYRLTARQTQEVAS